MKRSSIRNIVERLHGEPARNLQVDVQPLHGGLEASVVEVTAQFYDRLGRHRITKLVAKRLAGLVAREAPIYERLVTEHARELAPRLLAIERQADDRSVIYLERVRPVRKWPWRNLKAAEELIGGLARFHLATAASQIATSLPPWDYEAELRRSSETILELLTRCRRSDFAPFARHLASVHRLSLALPAIRRELFGFSPFGTVAIHGDVHPGNALVRRRAGAEQAILIDWGRARLGSPLEDLSNWLQSLAYWEPQARRRHDMLFAAYLSAQGLEQRLSSDLRAAYWLAGASNALSGALEYYLWLLIDANPALASLKPAAAQLARDWLRIVRRAASVWS